MSNIRNAKITSKVRWASVHRPRKNHFSGDTFFQVDVVLDTSEKLAEMEKLLEAHNVSLMVINPGTGEMQPRINTDKEGTRFLTIKSPEFNSEGKRTKIRVKDTKGKPINPAVRIGNGTTATVEFFTYPKKRGKGSTLRLSGLTIVDFVAAPPPEMSTVGMETVDTTTNEELEALNEEGTNAVYSLSDER